MVTEEQKVNVVMSVSIHLTDWAAVQLVEKCRGKDELDISAVINTECADLPSSERNVIKGAMLALSMI